MTKEYRLQRFIEKATKLHKGKFNYSLVDYIDAHTKVIIICPEHGEFLQDPNKHLGPNTKGCVKCWRNIQRILAKEQIKTFDYSITTMTKEIYLEKCKAKYGDRFQYDLTDFKGLAKSKIKITCPIHGEFIASARSHILNKDSTGCKKCSFELMGKKQACSYIECIEKCNKKHNFVYDYPEYNEFTYINNRSILEIICRQHGLFKLKVTSHLIGRGCPECMREFKIKNNLIVGGYSEKLFKNRPELKTLPAYLYYLEINNGKYYKIGISKHFPDVRVSDLVRAAKREGENLSIKIISSKYDTLYNCFRLEQQILKDFKNIRVFRRWSTELFSKNIFDKIKNLIV